MPGTCPGWISRKNVRDKLAILAYRNINRLLVGRCASPRNLLRRLCAGANHAQTHFVSLPIQTDDSDLHGIADGHDIGWMAHECIAELGDVHQAIGLDAYIHKSTKVHHVTHGTDKFHTDSEIDEISDFTAEDNRRRIFAGGWSFELVANSRRRIDAAGWSSGLGANFRWRGPSLDE